MVGSDANADGFGDVVGSSGGFVRLRYALDPGDHAYLGVRYDAAATPIATRDVRDLRGGDGRSARTNPDRETSTPSTGATALSGAITLGLPWPWGL